jgi:hypothetical protein
LGLEYGKFSGMYGVREERNWLATNKDDAATTWWRHHASCLV